MKSLRFYSSVFLFSLSSFSFFAHADFCDDHPEDCFTVHADRYSNTEGAYRLYAESGGRAGKRLPSSGDGSTPLPPKDDIDEVTVTGTREQYDTYIDSSGRAGVKPPPGYTKSGRSRCWIWGYSGSSSGVLL